MNVWRKLHDFLSSKKKKKNPKTVDHLMAETQSDNLLSVETTIKILHF